jgi:hypothetical protein
VVLEENILALVAYARRHLKCDLRCRVDEIGRRSDRNVETAFQNLRGGATARANLGHALVVRPCPSIAPGRYAANKAKAALAKLPFDTVI